MKKLVFGIVSIFVALIVAVLVAPNFIEWNQYRDQIAREAKSRTGRDIEINGDITIALLPSPRLMVADVHLINVEGTSDADMISLGALEIKIALAPLLSGNVRVQSVKLVRPVINLELLAGGRSNMVFDFSGPKSSSQEKRETGGKIAPPENEAGALESFASSLIKNIKLSVENFVVENGALVFRDTPAGTVERISNLNGRFRLASLKGPIEAAGSAVVRGIPISFGVNTGALVQNRTLPLSMDVSIIPGDVKLRFQGALTGLNAKPGIKGRVSIDGGNLRNFVAALGGGILSAKLARGFGATADIDGNQTGGSLKNIQVQLNDIKGNGKLDVKIGKTTSVDISFAVSHLDLDSMLKPPKIKPKPTNKKSGGALKSTMVITRLPAGKKFRLRDLPANLEVSLNLSVEAMTFKGAVIRQAKLNGSLANREITLNQLSALLPGSSDVALFGFISDKNGAPHFEGSIDASTNDLRNVFDRFGISTIGIAKERLRKLSFSAKVSASEKLIRIDGLKARLDRSKISGAATVALRARPSFGLNLIIDRLNLDAYLPKSEKSSAKPPPAKSSAGSPSESNPAKSNPVIPPIGALAGFDANFQTRIGSLTYKKLPLTGLRATGSLINGNLTIKDFRVRNVAGIAAKFSGGVTGLKSGKLALKKFKFEVRGEDLTRLFRLIDFNSPVTAREIGKFALTGIADGDFERFNLIGSFSGLGGKSSIDGVFTQLAGDLGIDSRFSYSHPHLIRLLRKFRIAYNPVDSNLGGLKMAGRITGNRSRIKITDFKGVIAKVSMQGSVDLDLSGPTPKFASNFTTGDINMDRFIPAKRRASLERILQPAIIPAAFTPLPASTDGTPLIQLAANKRWATDVIDLSPLSGIDGDIKLRSRSISGFKYRMDRADIALVIRNGVLDVRRVTGNVYGGELKADAKVTRNAKGGRYETRFTVTGLQVSRALAAQGTKAVRSGVMNVTGDLRANGRSIAEIVSTLQGDGKFNVGGLDVSSAGKGSIMSGLTGLVSSLNKFAIASGGRKGAGFADISSSFKINQGIAKFNDFVFSSNIGDGTAVGAVDLPNWRINADGRIKLGQNFVVQILTRNTTTPQFLPFSVKGSLDGPNVRLDTSKLAAGGIRIPGVTRRLEDLRNKKGVGQLLDQLLPGLLPGPAPAPTRPPSSAGAPPPQEPPQESPQAQTREKPKVQDLLKGLFGIGR